MAAIDVTQDPTQDFLPLFPLEDEATIWARWRAWANEGLDPVADADAWVDTREGSHWYVSVMPGVREAARQYDVMGTEVVMAGLLVWSWGEYLDDHATVWTVQRLPATPADGTLTFIGPPGTVIAAGTTRAVPPATPDDPAPEFEVTTGGMIPVGGSLDLPIVATEPGVIGNVSAGAITAESTPLPAGVTTTNAAPTEGGTEVENDEELRTRLLERFAGDTTGTARWYVREAKDWPGVGQAFVVGQWEGAGTVLVVVTDPNGAPTSGATVTALQAAFDPTPGLGQGSAPVGAVVTVQTATLLNMAVVATLHFETGYSLDGFGGTIAVRDSINKALSRYLATVPPGGEVVFEHVKGILSTQEGVHDISGVTLNGGTVNVAVGSTPPKRPVLATLTLAAA